MPHGIILTKEVINMPRFTGFRKEEWKKIELLLPAEPAVRGKGMPHTPWRKVLNTIAYVLLSGCRWCDTPKTRKFAPKTTAHRWLIRWEMDGTWDVMKRRILSIAEAKKLIKWKRAGVDGSFSPWERRRRKNRLWLERERSHAA
jgi:transposase